MKIKVVTSSYCSRYTIFVQNNVSLWLITTWVVHVFFKLEKQWLCRSWIPQLISRWHDLWAVYKNGRNTRIWFIWVVMTTNCSCHQDSKACNRSLRVNLLQRMSMTFENMWITDWAWDCKSVGLVYKQINHRTVNKQKQLMDLFVKRSSQRPDLFTVVELELLMRS